MVVGHSQTGEIDKIDGPYYFFKLIQKMRKALVTAAESKRSRLSQLREVFMGERPAVAARHVGGGHLGIEGALVIERDLREVP